ncbi:MAG: hypothetical protein ABGX87_12700 [Alcanivorax sp.]
MRDFSLQGKVYLGERLANGRPGAMHWIDDAGLLNISANVTEETRQESYSGRRQTSATLSTATEVTFNLTVRHATAKNLALGLYGKVNTVAAGSKTGEPLPQPLVVGDRVVLDRGNISSLALSDSADPAVELTEGTDYRIESAPGGIIEVLNDLSAFTAPYTADYEFGASTDITMFTQRAPIRYLMLDGVNTVDDTGDLVRVRLYRLKFNPVNQLDLINESFGELALSGTALFDPMSEPDPALGGFGRFELLGEAP